MPPSAIARLRAFLRDVFSVDLRALALFRVGLGLVILADLRARWADLAAHYTDAGVLPVALHARYYPRQGPLNLHAWSGSYEWQAFLFAAAAVLAVMLAAGRHARFAAAGSWLLLMSLHLRNPLVLHSGDNLLRLLLLWAVFLPIAAVWSLDARKNPLPPWASRRGFSIATVGVLLQTPMIYMGTAVLKARWPGWFDGEALYMALASDFWSRASCRVLLGWPGVLPFLGPAVLAWEFAGPVLLFVPWRRHVVRHAALAAFVFMQASFGLFLYIGLFPIVSILALVPFLRLWDGPERPPATRDPFRLPRPAAVLCGAALCVLLTHELRWAAGVKTMPAWWRRSANMVGLWTPWTMFSASQSYRGYYVWAGALADGREVDLHTGRPLEWMTPPPVLTERFRNMRWAKFYFACLTPGWRGLYKSVLDYEIRRWNAEHPGETLLQAKVLLMWRPMMPMFNHAEPRPYELASRP